MKEIKRQLPPSPACGMLAICLNAQASRERTQIRLQPELSPFRPVNLFRILIEKRERTLLRSRLVNWAVARAASNAPDGSPQSNGAKSLKKRPIRGGLVTRNRSRNGFMPFADSAFLKVLKETRQHESFRLGLIKKLETDFDGKVITFFTSFRERDAMIVDQDAEMLESVLSSEPTQKKIVLVISSPGGMPLASERIANVLRAYSPKPFEAVVPHMAKSAATMICFGAGAIHMSKTAELGPVDPQIPYWTTGEEEEPDWVSAEEYVRSYDNLIALGIGGKAKRLEPIMLQLSRYDSRFIEKVRSFQKLAEDISIRLLKTSMMKKRSVTSIRQCIDVFLKQTRTRTHGRMINHEEAKACGLNIKLVDLHSALWHTMWELFVRSDWCVRNTCNKLIETSKTSVHV